MTGFERVIPILRVDDLVRSVDYYVRVLGFTLDWQDPGVLASVSRDRCVLYLAEGDQGHPGSWVWIGVENVESLYVEYVTRGAAVRMPPSNYPWALEMHVQDPDGNVLRFGSEPRTDRPIGDWKDMHGVVWRWVEGRWTRVS